MIEASALKEVSEVKTVDLLFVKDARCSEPYFIPGEPESRNATYPVQTD